MEKYWNAANRLSFQGGLQQTASRNQQKLGLGTKAVILADQGCTNMPQMNMRTQEIIKQATLAVVTNYRTAVSGLN
jgi:hypothetical protein